MVRLVGGYLEGAAPRLLAAAATLGATPWRTLWRVTLPVARPAILAAAVLVFVFSFTSFGVILILAPSPELATLEVEIYRLSDRLLRLDAAAVLALSQLLVILLATVLYTRLQARMAIPLAGQAGPRERPRGGARALLFVTVAGAGLLVLAPLLALAFQAFWQSGGFTLGNVRALLEAPPSIGFAGLGPALRNSLGFAPGERRGGAATRLRGRLCGGPWGLALARRRQPAADRHQRRPPSASATCWPSRSWW